MCPVPLGFGGTWNQDDVIVFGRFSGGLHQVEATGGEPNPLTALDVTGAQRHLWPQFLPDGEHFLFLAVAPEDEESGIYIGSLESGSTPTHVMQTATMARYAAPGSLLFGQDGTLMAQPFDLERLGVMGDPVARRRGGFAGGSCDQIALFLDVGPGWARVYRRGLIHADTAAMGGPGGTLRECEAEAVALLFCAVLELPGIDEARGYIQHWWGQGHEIPEPSARRILKVADQILKAGVSS